MGSILRFSNTNIINQAKFYTRDLEVIQEKRFAMLPKLICLCCGKQFVQMIFGHQPHGLHQPGFTLPNRNRRLWTNCFPLDIGSMSLSGCFRCGQYFPALRPHSARQQRREVSHALSPTEHAADPRRARCCWRSQDEACKCFGFHREIQSDSAWDTSRMRTRLLLKSEARALLDSQAPSVESSAF